MRYAVTNLCYARESRQGFMALKVQERNKLACFNITIYGTCSLFQINSKNSQLQIDILLQYNNYIVCHQSKMKLILTNFKKNFCHTNYIKQLYYFVTQIEVELIKRVF